MTSGLESVVTLTIPLLFLETKYSDNLDNLLQDSKLEKPS